MATKVDLLPQDIDISSGLIDIPAHIVARSVAREIVQYGMIKNAWPRVTARLLTAQGFCYEHIDVVEEMLHRLAEAGFLVRDERRCYSVTDTFLLYCRRKAKREPDGRVEGGV